MNTSKLTTFATTARYLWRIAKRIIVAYQNEITVERFDSGLVEFYLADHIQIDPKSFAHMDHFVILGDVFLFHDGRLVAWCKADAWELMRGGV